MTATTIRGEFDEYIATLTDLQVRLLNYQARMGDRHLFTDQVCVFLVAIEGLLTRLTTPMITESITLDDIVKIADDVTQVTTASTHFLNHRPLAVS